MGDLHSSRRNRFRSRKAVLVSAINQSDCEFKQYHKRNVLRRTLSFCQTAYLLQTQNSLQNTPPPNTTPIYAGFLLGIFFGAAKSIVLQISFVMLLFSDQISGRGKSFQGGLPQGGHPLPPCGRKPVRAYKKPFERL